MRKPGKYLHISILAGLSAVLLGLTYPRLNLWIFSFIGLVPLFVTIRNMRPAPSFWIGYLMGCIYTSICSYWLIDTLTAYGNMPIEVAYGIFILLVLSIGLYFGFFCFFITYSRQRHGIPYSLLAPSLMVILEWIRAHVTVGFPWNNLGYSLYSQTLVIQVADITSAYGLTYWIVLTNCAIYEIFFERFHGKYRYNAVIASACFLVIFLGYGIYRTNQDVHGKRVTVAVLQGNIGINEKWDPRFRQEILDKYSLMSRKIVDNNVELIVWPEASLPYRINSNQVLRENIFNLARDLETHLVVGGSDYDSLTGKSYNAAFLISPSKKITATYYKIKLVPFGEYVPWKKIFFFIDKITDAYGTFFPGDEPVVMNVGAKFKTSVFICYETLFPELLRKFVANGAEILLNITNDAWFGNSAAPYHHFSLLTFRAIENRVPIARAANTGISGFVDSNGRIIYATDIFVQAAAKETLALDNRVTFYTRFGDVFVYCCMMVIGFYYVTSWIRNSKTKKRAATSE